MWSAPRLGCDLSSDDGHHRDSHVAWSWSMTPTRGRCRECEFLSVRPVTWLPRVWEGTHGHRHSVVPDGLTSMSVLQVVRRVECVDAPDRRDWSDRSGLCYATCTCSRCGEGAAALFYPQASGSLDDGQPHRQRLIAACMRF